MNNSQKFFELLFIYFLLFFSFILDIALLRASYLQSTLPLSCLYFFMAFRPAFMPYILLFILGLLYDIVIGYALGLTALYLLVTKYILEQEDKLMITSSYFMSWIGAVIFFLGYFTVQWVGNAIANWFFYDFDYLQPTFVLALLIYPVFAFMASLGLNLINKLPSKL